MNYKKKIQEIRTEINIINKYYINQVTNPSKETINRLEELTKEHYILLKKRCLSIILLFSTIFLVFILYPIFH